MQSGSMTLDQVVDTVKDNKNVSVDDLRYALLVYVSMFNVEHRKLRDELNKGSAGNSAINKMKMQSSFDMYKAALNTKPKDYLGWNSDPANPEYQKMRSAGIKIIDKIFDKEIGRNDDNEQSN